MLQGKGILIVGQRYYQEPPLTLAMRFIEPRRLCTKGIGSFVKIFELSPRGGVALYGRGGSFLSEGLWRLSALGSDQSGQGISYPPHRGLGVLLLGKVHLEKDRPFRAEILK